MDPVTEETRSRTDNTRAAIVSAAHRLFLDQGYHGTSMRQIALNAGIALGGIYNHFGSKEDVFKAVFTDRHPYHKILPAMNSAQGETVPEFVRDAAHLMVAALDQTEFLKLMFIELVEFNGRHVPDLIQDIVPQLMAFAQRFAEKPGEIKPIPLPVLMRAFIGLFFSYTITQLLVVPHMSPEMQVGALDQFVDIFLNGILANGAQEVESL
jgi:AcrR family transcriptional regulator